MHTKLFRLWAKALGEKASERKAEADLIALVRTIIFFSYLTTNAFIIAGVIRHW
jgi:predicted HAD superfamily Cof-like phosphohydrolase